MKNDEMRLLEEFRRIAEECMQLSEIYAELSNRYRREAAEYRRFVFIIERELRGAETKVGGDPPGMIPRIAPAAAAGADPGGPAPADEGTRTYEQDAVSGKAGPA